MENIQIKKYSYMDVDADIAWYSQYGSPQQACYYPELKKMRAKVMRRLMDRGVDIRDFNGYTVDYDGSIHLPVRSLMSA